jgi:hypothetical protein
VRTWLSPTPTGQSYTARLDGADAPYNGDPGTTSVSVKHISHNTLEEAISATANSSAVFPMTLAPGSKANHRRQ